MIARLGYMPKNYEKPEKVNIVTKQIRFPDDLAHKLNVIASINGETIAMLCDRLFREIIDAEHHLVIRQLAESVRKPK